MTGNSLVFYSPGAKSWQEFSLPEAQQNQTLGIGRGTENLLNLNDPGISINHALLRVNFQGIFIQDLHSTSGVFLNGQRIPANQWILLSPGSTLILGQTMLRLESKASTSIGVPHIPPPLVNLTPAIPPAIAVKKRG